MPYSGRWKQKFDPNMTIKPIYRSETEMQKGIESNIAQGFELISTHIKSESGKHYELKKYMAVMRRIPIE